MGDIRSILFVCTGNSCRSIMAEGLMRKKLYELGKIDVEVYSAGVMASKGAPPTEETINVMKQAGVDVSGFTSKPVTDDMVKKVDLILTMEPVHKELILKKSPKAASKVFTLKEYANPSKVMPKGYSIHDPIGKTLEFYMSTRDEINTEIERIVRIL